MIRPYRPEVCFPESLEVFDELVEFRHDLHQHPELAFETARTCEKIAEKLRAWGADEVDTHDRSGRRDRRRQGEPPGQDRSPSRRHRCASDAGQLRQSLEEL